MAKHIILSFHEVQGLRPRKLFRSTWDLDALLWGKSFVKMEETYSNEQSGQRFICVHV